MPLTKDQDQLYIANDSFVANIDGIDKAFHAGVTLARAGDKAVELYPHLFDPLTERHPTYQA